MPTKTAKSKPRARVARPVATRRPRLARYITVVGDLAAAMKTYQKLLQKIDGGKKVDVTAFEQTIKAMNRAGDQFDALTAKHEKAILDYVDDQAA